MHSFLLNKLGELRTARYSLANNALHSNAQKVRITNDAPDSLLRCSAHIKINNLFAFSSPITHPAGLAKASQRCIVRSQAIEQSCSGSRIVWNECCLLAGERSAAFAERLIWGPPFANFGAFLCRFPSAIHGARRPYALHHRARCANARRPKPVPRWPGRLHITSFALRYQRNEQQRVFKVKKEWFSRAFRLALGLPFMISRAAFY